VTQLGGHRMFRFQMVIDGQVVGDEEHCIPGSAMHRLGNLRHLDNERLHGIAADPLGALCSWTPYWCLS
jgi:hypothetical protein